MEQLLTTSEAAAILGVTRQTVFRAIVAGSLKAMAVGPKPMYVMRLRDIEAFGAGRSGVDTLKSS
jgi:excisionase family DNA binding protein